jgi:hypothetical protein
MDDRSNASRWLPLALAAVFLVGRTGTASAQFSISRFTIDGGGTTRSAAGIFALGGTVGQPDAGRLTGPGFGLQGGFWFGGSAVSGVGEHPPGSGPGLPANPGPPFRVYSARPNPVVHRTVIAFDLPAPTPVKVALFDVSGRLLRVLVDASYPAGAHRSTWDLRDESGRIVAPGIYFLRLDAGVHRSHQRIVVVH